MVEALLGIQIIAILFSIFMVYIAFLHFKQKNITNFEFMFWFGVWSIFIYFTLFPRVLDPILAKLFISRAMDLLMLLAFMILTFMGFQNHIGVKHLQKKVESLVRKEALRNVKK